MISKEDRKLLQETYKNASMAVDAIYVTMDKVEDEEMALELTRQLGKFNSIQDRAEEEMIIIGEKPKKSVMSRMMLKMGIKRKLMTNRKASHVADMMIQGNTMGIVDTTKSMHDNLTAKREYSELAGELVEFEQRNIDRLKNYL